MPAAQAFPLEKLMSALHAYQKNSQQKIFIEYIMLDKVNDEEPHAHQLGKLLETSQVVKIDVASPEAGVIKELVAKEGETMEPCFKIAIISKSGEGVAHVALLEKIPERAAPKPSLAERIEEEKPNPKVETAPVLEKQPKSPSLPPTKCSATEPQLPPKGRERWVPMTRLQKRVATTLKDSQNTFAMLTTFDEVDMAWHLATSVSATSIAMVCNSG
ncbi:dihydrolipoyllysine-residue succinyltransferase component of 2-oxoglutarate dehydrogenase complex 1, mitochondrial-like isoform X2 [Mangifera indica]|uniref:dihydrolipoyllysine-residue succinyltransferase component of 2-oxoglutarate dehydrogenase complex 1, mitochondrial-like isoform X2 n=1 Tax=Mangifera indica TaxID=29780 RepID=UPI001CF994B8|nr:dihydrolipoyllysine-residue succinyltransferase component of 2-oxoglutarate dehydrogenase complex 1, mitochondrial-like isoform X2 [Mangifera indica]